MDTAFVGRDLVISWICAYLFMKYLNKGDRLLEVFEALYVPDKQMSKGDIIDKLGVSESSLKRYIIEFNLLAKKMVKNMNNKVFSACAKF